MPLTFSLPDERDQNDVAAHRRYVNARTVDASDQSGAAVVADYALDRGTHISFVRLTGSLRGDPKGTVVETTAASIAHLGYDGVDLSTNSSPSVSRTHLRPFIEVAAHAVSINCLARSTQQHEHPARRADRVNLETGLLLKAAATCGQPVRSILAISDGNGSAFVGDISDMRQELEEICCELMSVAIMEVEDHG